mgnify:CR=1 FL=1
MATYVNDLRLTELATGEGSGSWGTTTNVSLELIGEALGYATQQVFGSDADATTTIADGASDPARAMYFKITSAGSLTATRTCTIAPNTVSRVMFIENATTGSQSIAISQGSGANVTIATGKTAVVYLDGAGSGAAVVDAMAGVDPGVTDTLAEVLTAGNTTTTDQKIQFRDTGIYINSSADGQLDIVADTEIQIAATTIDINGAIVASGEISAASLDISGDIDVDGTTNLDVVDIDGAVDMASTLTLAGNADFNGDLDVDGTIEFDALSGTGSVTVTDILDEDNMASNSATVLATQQSIKAYVDAQVDTVDTLAEILAIGNTTTTDQKIQFRDTGIFINSSADGQLDIVADTEIQIAATTIDINGNLDVSGTLGATGVLTANAGVVVDNITIDGNEIDVGSGDLTLDVAGDIILDADGGDIQLKDAGVATGRLGLENGDLNIASMRQDYDIKFKGMDGNTTPFTALTLDMSAAGAATFNSTITLKDTLSISSTSTSGFLQASSNVLQFGTSSDDRVDFYANNAVALSLAADGSLSTPTAGTSNVRFGVNAGNSIASGGNYNVVVGDEAGTAITTGDDNVAVGYNALGANTTGVSNVAVGANALDANTTAANNVAVGGSALTTNTTGASNTAVGKFALRYNTTASNNTAMGQNALSANTTGTQNVAVGASSLDANTTAGSNTAIGYNSLSANTTGTFNTALGRQALLLNTTASNNVAVGGNALFQNTTGTSNVALGAYALDSNTTASNNTAVGANALSANTTGASNTAVGVNAGLSVTTGINNTLIGGLAGDALTDADSNTAIGYNSLTTNTLGSAVTAVGSGALALHNVESAAQTFNTAVGYDAGNQVRTGTSNTIMGALSGDGLTVGSGNTLIGFESGSYGTNLTTGATNTLVGAYNNTTAVDSAGAMGFGYNLDCAAGYTTLGSGTSDIRAAHGVATWATVSDERYKKDITDSTAGLSFINALRPRTWNYKTLGELPETFRAYEADSTEVFKNTQTNHGFIAQEVKVAIDADSGLKDGFRLWDDREDGSQEVAEAALIPVLTKAIQELSAQVDALTARLTTLEG